MEKAKPIMPQTGNKVYRDQLVTLGELQEFKNDLLLSIKTILQSHFSQAAQKWLKSYEVQKLLGISKGTLQVLRDNGTLTYTRIGRLCYYDADDIQKLLTERKEQIQHGGITDRKRQALG